jgi:type II secretory pathway component GspD/PulD (secretin)
MATVSYAIPNVPADRQTEVGLVLGGGARIVLGGLSRAREGAADAKIPILADIALLGRLFENSRRAQVRAGLLVFIKPTIIR